MPPLTRLLLEGLVVFYKDFVPKGLWNEPFLTVGLTPG